MGAVEPLYYRHLGPYESFPNIEVSLMQRVYQCILGVQYSPSLEHTYKVQAHNDIKVLHTTSVNLCISCSYLMDFLSVHLLDKHSWCIQ